MWNFFEQPWTLLGAAVLVLFGVLTFRSVWSEKTEARGNGSCRSASPSWAWAWTSPWPQTWRRSTTSSKRASRRSKTENCAAIAPLIADDYQDSYHKNKESLLGQCRIRLVPPAVQKIRKISSKVEIHRPMPKWLSRCGSPSTKTASGRRRTSRRLSSRWNCTSASSPTGPGCSAGPKSARWTRCRSPGA